MLRRPSVVTFRVLFHACAVALLAQRSCISLATTHHISTHTYVNKLSIDTLFGDGVEPAVTDIKCLLCDIDGTFVTDQHEVSDNAINAIQALMDKGLHFSPATGRTRKSVSDVTGDALDRIFKKPLNQVPGVFAQGLTVYGTGGDVIFNRFLEPDVISKVVSFCDREGLALIGYAGDRILCRKRCAQTDKLTLYCEPVPDEHPAGLETLHTNGIQLNKVIIMADEAVLLEKRPGAEAELGGCASLTRAVPGMLEVLPKGASKGDGVLRLLKHYGISPTEAIAFGDGENDVEMLQNVKLGIAVENAKPELKAIAGAVTKSNNDDGVGYVLHKLLAKLSTADN